MSTIIFHAPNSNSSIMLSVYSTGDEVGNHTSFTLIIGT